MTDSAGSNSFRFSFWRALYLLRSGKFREFFSALSRKSKTLVVVDEDQQYQKWIQENEPDEAALSELSIWCSNLNDPPLITFILRNCSDRRTIRSNDSIIDQ